MVGYCGGSTADPTYKSIGDHTEALRVTFDSRVVTAESRPRSEEALRVMWGGKPRPREVEMEQLSESLKKVVAFARPVLISVSARVGACTNV